MYCESFFLMQSVKKKFFAACTERKLRVNLTCPPPLPPKKKSSLISTFVIKKFSKKF